MTEPERRAAELRTLLARLSHQQQTIDRISKRLDRAEARLQAGIDAEVVASVALFLQHFYTAIEDAMLRIAGDLDGSVPDGDGWHRSLLEQMALDIPDIRPPLLDPELSRRLDVLRRFRHRVRHAYDEDYDWERMSEPVQSRRQASALVPAFFDGVESVVREIVEALDQT